MDQHAFEEIKNRLLKPTTLHLLNHRCILQLFSDTSKTVVVSALYQILNVTLKLIGYASKG